MGEVREKMRRYKGQRVTVRGVLDGFGDWIRNRRDVGRACIRLPEIDHEVVASHVWVTDVPHWLPHKDQVGTQIEFDAVVDSYDDDKLHRTNFCLRHAGPFKVLHQPALRIPEPAEEDDAPPPCVVRDEPPPPPDGGSELDKLRQVKRFVKACGGQEHAARLVEALAGVTMAVADLRTWVAALGEE
jgi:hypothetical protein